MEKKCMSLKSDLQNVLWLCVSFVLAKFVITALEHEYGPLL